MGKFSFKYSRAYEGRPAEKEHRGLIGSVLGGPQEERFYHNPEDTIESTLGQKCLSIPASGNPNDIWGSEFAYFNGDCLVRISVPYVRAKKTYDREVNVQIMPVKEIPSDLEELFNVKGFHKIRVLE